jgi:hypothetical protein
VSGVKIPNRNCIGRLFRSIHCLVPEANDGSKTKSRRVGAELTT